MSMLAGPRRKQKVINLRAKNNAWSNDTNKFGQKMLEKMGWSAGKGLGAKENGITDHVVARYKNDEKGLGFEDKNDQWTKHEDDFNTLLANLSNTENNSEILHSGISLEDKSKKSKSRIHYHKFTRGKDLSRYSQKDLANIFGKKSFNEKDEEELLKDEVNTSEQVFTEKGSMDDYFKNKLALLKSKSKVVNNHKELEEENVSDYGFKGFSNDSEIVESNNGFGYQPFSLHTAQKDCEKNDTPDKEITKSKKKKKSKNKLINLNEDQNCNDGENKLEINIESELQISKVKKSKKKKYQEHTQDIDEYGEGKKKSKNSQDDNDQDEPIIYEKAKIPKKKKKRKNKDM